MSHEILEEYLLMTEQTELSRKELANLESVTTETGNRKARRGHKNPYILEDLTSGVGEGVIVAHQCQHRSSALVAQH